MAAFVSIF
ncbi:hypothetical protein CIB84_004632 [Bambusicola thoracicus]|uniref:Uncharacterized protein n=1 Tax=Bambusicola thoracicus TaxID=9083 RepID=A0A2P4T5L8_BAMTH|nr:hypothetical protein CIB84_004632 [Bambusicola thoracicus]